MSFYLLDLVSMQIECPFEDEFLSVKGPYPFSDLETARDWMQRRASERGCGAWQILNPGDTAGVMVEVGGRQGYMAVVVPLTYSAGMQQIGVIFLDEMMAQGHPRIEWVDARSVKVLAPPAESAVGE